MTENRLHYGLVGLGSIGTVFTVMLKQAGYRVSILEQMSQKVEYVKKNPLKVSGELTGEAQVDAVYDNLEEFLSSKPDVICICTKSCDSPSILEKMKALQVSPETVFISCQNGLDVEDQIRNVFGPERTLRMVINLGCGAVGPGEIKVLFCFKHYLSNNEAMSEWVETICRDFNEAGLHTKVHPHYRNESYKKAILNSAMSTPCAVTGLTMKEAMDNPEVRWIVESIVKEAIQVAGAIGLDITPEYEKEAKAYLAKGGAHKPSMAVDIDNKRHTENEQHCGRILALATEKGLQVPVVQTIYSLMKQLEARVTS